MSRWTSILGALLLVLMLWTGGAAQAANVPSMEPIAIEAVAHFDGDKDEVPSDRHQGTPHHHSVCGEHQVATASDLASPSVHGCASNPRLARAALEFPGREPDWHLRPPIA